ncbi:ABC transporter permease [Argonema antarcticum]|uniref:ABC transporter permease n=1 Tax=Argonema antarcticum TaxID=2942763 RepID=UPI0020120677|nr:ABC transporter permease [Argonema antarcticum]MCL1469503.1 ABC transporter permease [Argonema antarcticum A004/B2]
MSLSAFDLILLTCKSLLGNPLRSGLTTLGVFMGVAAVSATLQVGNISRAVIEKQLAEREAPQVNIYADELKLDDLEFLRQRLTGLKAISATQWLGPSQTVFRDRQAEPFIYAVTLDHFLTSGKQKIAGRFFTPADFDNYRPVVVIDLFLAEKLFQGEDAIGQRIYAEGRPYIVVGVVPIEAGAKEPKGEMTVPMSIYNAITGSRDLGSFQIRPRNLEDINNLEDKAVKLLKQRYPDKDFYSYNNVKQILEQKQTLEMASRGLTAVGAISLLIGGVGIANISIAAVMERTPEIGLRLAIGATKWDILLQFILEAAFLSLFGGIVAIVTVHGLTLAVSDTFKLPYKFDRETAVLSLGSALLVGVGASFIPALQASNLDPVKALRGG